MQDTMVQNNVRYICNSATNSNTTESKIDQDIIDQEGKTQLGFGDNHRGTIKIGSSEYIYTRRLKDPFQVDIGENPYAYTLERVNKSFNI